MTRGTIGSLLRSAIALVGALLLSGTLVPALAHKPSDSFVTITLDSAALTGEWHIALRDLEYAIGLDENRDGKISWGETQSRHSAIVEYAFAHLAVSTDSEPCKLIPGEQLIDKHTDGAYSVLRFSLQCSAEALKAEQLTIDYSLFFELDPQHRGLIALRSKAATGELSHQLAIAEPNRRSLTFQLQLSGASKHLRHFIQEGIWHIWIGFDHILFLLALLLPSVLTRKAGRWVGVGNFSRAFWNVAKVVTAFTVAHSITLSLAALDVVALPSRLVESVIAASVVLAALNNLYPLFGERRAWMVAFGFGLIHGFGFAGVLSDFGLQGWTLVTALVSFNVGVELGQLCIVGAFLPCAFALRQGALYRRLAMTTGSAAIALIALGWFVERAFNMSIFG